jgi:SnoaL-like domain
VDGLEKEVVLTELERLVATDEIRELMARYVRYADHKQWHELAGLFVPDGTFTPHGVDGTVIVRMAGREDIARKINAAVGSATAIHHLFSYEVTLRSPASARAIFSMEDWIVRPDHELLVRDAETGIEPFRTLHGYGHYHGAYERIDGTWFIAELTQTRLKLDFTY